MFWLRNDYVYFIFLSVLFEVNSLFDSETKVCYVTQVFKQGINVKTMCHNYILKFRNTQMYSFLYFERKSSINNQAAI